MILRNQNARGKATKGFEKALFYLARNDDASRSAVVTRLDRVTQYTQEPVMTLR